jgi:hypothetical protein
VWYTKTPVYSLPQHKVASAMKLTTHIYPVLRIKSAPTSPLSHMTSQHLYLHTNGISAITAIKILYHAQNGLPVQEPCKMIQTDQVLKNGSLWFCCITSSSPQCAPEHLPTKMCDKNLYSTIFLTAVYIQKAYSNMTQGATAQWLTRSTDIIRPCSSVLCRC